MMVLFSSCSVTSRSFWMCGKGHSTTALFYDLISQKPKLRILWALLSWFLPCIVIIHIWTNLVLDVSFFCSADQFFLERILSMPSLLPYRVRGHCLHLLVCWIATEAHHDGLNTRNIWWRNHSNPKLMNCEWIHQE